VLRSRCDVLASDVLRATCLCDVRRATCDIVPHGRTSDSACSTC
jgi:hypothetical protein